MLKVRLFHNLAMASFKATEPSIFCAPKPPGGAPGRKAHLLGQGSTYLMTNHTYTEDMSYSKRTNHIVAE